MTRILSSLTARVIGLLAAGMLFSSCFGEGGDQVHGMLHVSFSSTAVCQAQQKLIPFRNISGSEIVIEGAAISGGTDPDGNFSLVSVQVGPEEILAVSGILNDIHVPANTDYSFAVSYTPRTENVTNSAVLDIAYSAPKQGVIQVDLQGIAASRAPTCPSGGGSVTPGAGNLDGSMTITISRIALVSSALSQPISTDPSNTVTAFEPVEVPISFAASSDGVTLPAISESVEFLLPRTKTNPLFNLIKGMTLVTSMADATGTYDDEGDINLPNVAIHLKECFETDFVVTLTTQEVTIPNNLPKNLLRTAGFDLSEDQTEIFGSSISTDTFETTLIGIATFTNASGPPSCTVAQSISGTSGAVIIDAVVNVP